MFHGLLKAHAPEARAVVRQALEVLTPAMPGRMEDGNVSNTFHLVFFFYACYTYTFFFVYFSICFLL